VPRMTAQKPIVTSFLTCLSFSKAPISWHHIPHVSLDAISPLQTGTCGMIGRAASRCATRASSPSQSPLRHAMRR
jgi:hypothetical protein